MGQYKRIIAAVELDPACDDVAVEKALTQAKQDGASVTLVHAVEHMSSYGAAYGIAAGADIEEMLVENAQQSMAELGAKLGLS